MILFVCILSVQDENQDEQPVEEPRDAETPEETNEVGVEEEFIPDDPIKVEQAERTLREANLARVRGHTAVADRLLKEAIELAPNTATVLEAIGDDYVVRGQFRKAKEAYKKAHQIDPKNASVENKYGEMVLKVDLHIDPFAHAEEFSGYASPKIAIMLNILAPGLGQFAVERYVKGGIMLGAHAILLALMALLPGGFQSVFGFMTGKAAFDPLGGLLLGIDVIVILWSIADLSSMSKKAPKKIDPPVPPSEWMG